MSKYYILKSRCEFYENEVFTADSNICGLFDDISKARELASKLLMRCKVIVGEENVQAETLTSVNYTTIDGISARYELEIICVTKLNEEL